MILRKILQLHDTSRKTPSAIRTIKLKHSPRTAVSTDGASHRLIFLHRGFRKLLTKHQYCLQRSGNSGKKCSHRLLVERLRFDTVVFEPFLHLRHTVRILKLGQILQPVHQLIFRNLVNLDGILHERHIKPYSTIIDFLVEHIFLPHRLRHRIFGQTFLDRHLHFDIAAIVRLKEFPLLACRFVERRH